MRSKYIIIDRELEEAFLVGDMKIAGWIIGRSARTLEKWLHGTKYRDEGRFIIVKNPHIIKNRQQGHVTAQFLKHKFVKKKI